MSSSPKTLSSVILWNEQQSLCVLVLCVKTQSKWDEHVLLFSRSVVSDSLWPHDCSPPGSSVHGILQARMLEWVAIFSSRGSSQARNRVQVSCFGRWILYCWATREWDDAPFSFLTLPVKWPSSLSSLQFITLINGDKHRSVQLSCSVVSDSLRPHGLQHTRLPCPSSTPGVHSNWCPLSQWCHPAISASVVPFSSCPQSFPASESFPMSQLFAWGGQSIGISALASFLPKKIQDRSPLECTGWISLQSKGLSRVFSNTTVQKHQFFSAQLSSQSNSHIHTWLLEKPYPCLVIVNSAAMNNRIHVFISVLVSSGYMPRSGIAG